MENENIKLLSEYTADVGIECKGKDVRELIINSIKGLLLVIYGKVNPRIEKIEKSIELEFDISDRFFLIDLLDEILYYWSTYKLIPDVNSIQISEKNNKIILKIDLGRTLEKPIIEVKAVTYHDYVINLEKNNCFARIVFDV